MRFAKLLSGVDSCCSSQQVKFCLIIHARVLYILPHLQWGNEASHVYIYEWCLGTERILALENSRIKLRCFTYIPHLLLTSHLKITCKGN